MVFVYLLILDIVTKINGLNQTLSIVSTVILLFNYHHSKKNLVYYYKDILVSYFKSPKD